MGTQLSLPAGWASRFVSTPDPRDGLDALQQAKLDAKAAIRAQFDNLADRYGVQSREVDRAMDGIDDTIGDLIYEIETELRDQIDELAEKE